MSVLGLGDSDASGEGDPTGKGWVERYGELLQDRLGREVGVDNRAVEGQTSAELAAAVAQDQGLRDALAGADVVLLGIGGADLNRGDAALEAGSCEGKACYTDVLAGLGEDVATVVAAVRELAPHALVRAVTPPNARPGAEELVPDFLTAEVTRYQTEAVRRAVCGAVEDGGGLCVDVPAAFNGPALDQDAYAAGLMTKDPCCYPSAEGQQRIAELVLAAGVDGLG